VLYPLPPRDTLLRAAQQNLYAVRSSQRILDEVARNLVKNRRATPDQARSLVDVMQRAFADADVPEVAIASPEPTMLNEPGDRHVLAAAVASDAEAVVTFNVRHFPATACEPFGVEVVHPDAFLCELHERAPAKIRLALTEQAAALSRPPLTVTELLGLLAATVPDFVSQVRDAG
jgi:predicted nucleic acid-binding protein